MYLRTSAASFWLTCSNSISASLTPVDCDQLCVDRVLFNIVDLWQVGPDFPVAAANILQTAQPAAARLDQTQQKRSISPSGPGRSAARLGSKRVFNFICKYFRESKPGEKWPLLQVPNRTLVFLIKWRILREAFRHPAFLDEMESVALRSKVPSVSIIWQIVQGKFQIMCKFQDKSCLNDSPRHSIEKKLVH